MINELNKSGESKRSWLAIPPWIMLGAVLILAPIFVFWASENIKRQKESTTLLLLEKGGPHLSDPLRPEQGPA